MYKCQICNSKYRPILTVKFIAKQAVRLLILLAGNIACIGAFESGFHILMIDSHEEWGAIAAVWSVLFGAVIKFLEIKDVDKLDTKLIEP